MGSYIYIYIYIFFFFLIGESRTVQHGEFSALTVKRLKKRERERSKEREIERERERMYKGKKKG